MGPTSGVLPSGCPTQKLYRKIKFVLINSTLKYTEVEGASCPVNMRVRLAINGRLIYTEVEEASCPLI